MATRPAVSVIIPVYNGEEYLRECLDSVFSQTLKQIQVICVDDGSTDHSARILSEYVFQTMNVWGGTNQDIFWARVDDDLLRIMGQSFFLCDSRARKHSKQNS